MVCPALFPPEKRAMMSASSDKKSVILPLPSSPHCVPTTTVPDICLSPNFFFEIPQPFYQYERKIAIKIRSFLYASYKNIRKLVWRDVPVPVISVVLVEKAAVGLVEYQFDRAGRTVTVFCQDDFYLILLFLCPFGIIFPVAA